MKITLIGLAISLSIAVHSQGQNSCFRVIDQDSVAIPGALISYNNKDFTVARNDGSFCISIAEDSIFLNIQAGGYFGVSKFYGKNVGVIILESSVSELKEAVVISSGKNNFSMPGSVHRIDAMEMHQYNYTDINRTLRSTPGVTIQEEDGFGLRPNIGLRGSGSDRSSRITIMEDGILVAPAPYSAPSAYYFPTIGRMEGVEIVKGSSQIKYGPFTTGGAINLISSAIPNNIEGIASLSGGLYGGRNLHFKAGNSHKNIGYMAETFQYGSNGFKELDGGGNTGFNKADYHIKVRLNTADKAKISQSVTFKALQVNELSNETYIGLTETDFNNTPFRRYAASQKDKMEATHRLFSVTHLIQPVAAFKIITTAYTTNFSRNWYKAGTIYDSTGAKPAISDILSDPNSFSEGYKILTGEITTGDKAILVRANNRSYRSKGIQTILSGNFKTRTIQHQLNGGTRVHYDEMDRFQWDDQYAMNQGTMMLTKAGTPGSESNRIESAFAVASHIQYSGTLHRLGIHGGVRHEYIEMNGKNYGKNDSERTGAALTETSNFTHIFIPGGGITYRYNEKGELFAGVHKGFSPPGSGDETIPETSISYELGLRHFSRSFNVNSALFYSNYDNLLGADNTSSGGSGTGDLFNGGAAMNYGAEVSVSTDVSNFIKTDSWDFPIAVVYTYTFAKFLSSFNSSFEGWGTVTKNDELPYLPRHTGSVSVGAAHKNFNITINTRYTGEFITEPGIMKNSDVQKIQGYFIIDAAATVRIHKSVELTANLLNLTNKVYIAALHPYGYRPGMPCNFNGGIRFRF